MKALSVKTNKIIIGAMRPEDWNQVKQIYLDGIATGQATFETEAPSWEAWDDSHLPLARLVAHSGNQIVGWAALSPVSKRQAYAAVAEVSIYVAIDFRNQGVGHTLLESLIAESERHGIWTLQAIVFPENLATLALHRGCGFRDIGRRERIGKLNGAWRDTVLLERRSSVVGID
jgi:L-amino acid N-acyltransferase YncA